ncbi:unnamed protein product [Danaus chrysippus]|uniref:(African queen) hypothetical protein n=1 Tax=Danaus chrysippus TaxID=151541 RepID=A0A8J2VY47_9NEOP|nr:unnamed protein product [Danaus chrysippus]
MCTSLSDSLQASMAAVDLNALHAKQLPPHVVHVKYDSYPHTGSAACGGGWRPIACVCMWSTFYKIKDDIDSVTSREWAVRSDSCLLNRCPEEASTSTLFVQTTLL